jgi:hypothetical protein
MTRRRGEGHRLMAAMVRGCILVGGVTSQADAVGSSTKLGAIRLVAIAAGDTSREHLALLERAVIVDLVEHLPVGMVEPAGERRDDMGVGQRASGSPMAAMNFSAAMPSATRLAIVAR